MATFTDQFFLIDPYPPPPVGTQLNFVKLNLTDQNNDNDFDQFNNDSIDGSDITSSWPGDTVTINVPGVGNVTYTGVTFYLADGRRVFTPNDGQALQNGTLVSTTYVNTQGPLLVSQLGPPCFTPGTRIRTPGGAVPIEALEIGDAVMTLDNGARPVLWIGRTTIEGRGKHAPIRFEKGAIGNERALLVSPQHKILISGWQAQLYCGAESVLVPAKHLVNGGSIRPEPRDEVIYMHLLLERHEILFSEGVPSESFFPGAEQALWDRDVLADLQRRFGHLPLWRAGDSRQMARMAPRKREGRLLGHAA